MSSHGGVLSPLLTIASASWVFLLSSVLLIFPMYILMGKEEAFGLKTYGEADREYINRTPRWAGIRKSRDRR
jgi:protein-S-isoprenylcysteine O-methyltransferase Ste14